MFYSHKLSRAVRFSIKTHEVYQKQKRKGKDIPYIIHPMTVGLILAQAGADEDTVIAGILHDTIEDSVAERKVTRAMLVERFGEKVADLVESVTEMYEKDGQIKTWEERKAEAVAHIKDFSHESVLVKSADVLSNLTDIIDDFNDEGEQIFSRFARPKEKVLGHYLAVISALYERWPENPLAGDLKRVEKEMGRLLAEVKINK